MASVYRRPRSQYWWAAITLPGGKPSYFSTRLTDEKEALEVAIRAERATRRHKDALALRNALLRIVDEVFGRIHVSPKEWLEKWLKRREPEVEEGTIDAYRPIITEAGKFFAERKRETMGDITVEDIVDLRTYWAGLHSTNTANYKLKILRSVFKDAWQEHAVTENVVAKVPRLKKEKGKTATKRRPFQSHELKKLLEIAPPAWKCMSLLGLFAGGQRMGDFARLQRKDILWEEKEINTSAQKTGAPIILPIVPALAEILEALPLPTNPEEFLFPELAALTKAGRSKQFRRLLYDAGLAPKRNDHEVTGKGVQTRRRKVSELSYHSFRHTATTMLKAAGVSDAVARAIVGHESAAVSRTYTHMPMETLREAMEKIQHP